MHSHRLVKQEEEKEGKDKESQNRVATIRNFWEIP